MRARLLLAILLSSALFPAVKKITGSAHGENQDLTLQVTIYADPESVKEVLGDDLDGHYIVAQVKVGPKYGKDITIDRDDFILRTDKNGERTKPMAPSQIAGNSSLVLQRTSGPGGLGAEPTRGWSMGGPIGMGKSSGAAAPSDPNAVKAKMEQADKPDARRKLLEDKVLPEKKVDEPVTGLLYFPMEGQKLKDLELLFGAKETRIAMRFKEVK
jgi:hypothetical protein